MQMSYMVPTVSTVDLLMHILLSHVVGGSHCVFICPARSLLSMLHFAFLAVFHYDFIITILFYHLFCVFVGGRFDLYIMNCDSDDDTLVCNIL